MQGHEKVEAKIREIIEDFDSDIFVVEIEMIRGAKNILAVWVDTDEGITIDKCASISRLSNRYFEEEDPIPFPFTMQVSSPGVGRPLKLHRQYVKNVGRKLKVTLNDHQVIKGRLESVSDERITLKPEQKKKKKKGEPEGPETLELLLSDIKEAKVEISFD